MTTAVINILGDQVNEDRYSCRLVSAKGKQSEKTWGSKRRKHTNIDQIIRKIQLVPTSIQFKVLSEEKRETIGKKEKKKLSQRRPRPHRHTFLSLWDEKVSMSEID